VCAFSLSLSANDNIAIVEEEHKHLYLYLYVKEGTRPQQTNHHKIRNEGIVFFYFLKQFIQHCFICRPSDYTVLEDAGIGSMTIATLAWEISRSNHLASKSHPY
jgi:hypothetical protein